MNKKYWTGIGSRNTPSDIYSLMVKLSKKLCDENWILRSGGAHGADSAHYCGSIDSINNSNSEIYIPWNGFNQLQRNKVESTTYDVSFFDNFDKALKIAEKYHPAWNKLKQGGKALQARNCYELLGKDLNTPSKFVTCWTPNGGIVGGTGQALRMAIDYNISIYNLAIKDDLDKINDWLLKE